MQLSLFDTTDLTTVDDGLACAFGVPWMQHFGPHAACRFCDEPDAVARQSAYVAVTHG